MTRDDLQHTIFAIMKPGREYLASEVAERISRENDFHVDTRSVANTLAALERGNLATGVEMKIAGFGIRKIWKIRGAAHAKA